MNIRECAVRYLPFLKRVLTPPRLRHSMGVARVMGELAEVYSLDRASAMTAGLLHDVARDLSLKCQLVLAQEANIEFSHPCERHPVYLHALAGAYLASKEWGITDRAILSAIASHSYVGNGDSLNSPLSLCLRSADVLAPIQEWRGMKKLARLVYTGRIEEAFFLQCGWLIEYLEEKGIPVHPNLTKNLRALSARLRVDDSFFERW